MMMMMLLLLLLLLHVCESLEPALQPSNLIQREQRQRSIMHTASDVRMYSQGHVTHILIRGAVISGGKNGRKAATVHHFVPAHDCFKLIVIIVIIVIIIIIIIIIVIFPILTTDTATTIINNNNSVS